MSLRFSQNMIQTYNHGHLHIALMEPSPRHCDNCCRDIVGTYLPEMVHGTAVVLCSTPCAEELARVWAPAHRRWPWRQALRAMAACLTIVGIVLSL